MGLNVTQVHRNLQQRVTCMYLEFEDLFLILGLAAVTNVLGHFLNREIFGIPMNVFLQYVVPVLAIPLLVLFKYGKPRGYVLDSFDHLAKPKVYCGLERDAQQSIEYLQEGMVDAHDRP